MMKDAIVVDIETSIMNFQNALDVSSELLEEKWNELLKGSSLVINDIESIHNPVANKMGIPIVNISNFTWSDILNGLDANELDIKYSSLEKLADYSYQLPFSTPCLGFRSDSTKFGLLAKNIDWDWVSNTQNNYQDKQFVFFTRIGTYLEGYLPDLLSLLEKENIGVIIPDEYKKYLPPTIEYFKYSTNTQNVQDLIALSKIAIGKTGYSTVSEAVTAGTLYIHWTRNEFIEDKYLSDGLTSDGRGIKVDIFEDDNPLFSLYDLILNNINHNLQPISNSNREIAQSILNYIKD